jgi:hypothetical protein
MGDLRQMAQKREVLHENFKNKKNARLFASDLSQLLVQNITNGYYRLMVSYLPRTCVLLRPPTEFVIDILSPGRVFALSLFQSPANYSIGRFYRQT